MLKISRIGNSNDSVTLRLEGRVVGPWAEELSRICEPFLAEKRILKLDLAEVSYADAAGVALLNTFKARGAQLNHCSPFIAQQIKTA